MKMIIIVPLLIIVGFAVSLTSAFQVDEERTGQRAQRSNDRNARARRIRRGVVNAVAPVAAVATTTTKTPARPAPIRVDPAQSCGTRVESAMTRPFGDNLIVGGMDADVSEFPYIGSMRIMNRHFCGCSILNERWVLTAAHCVAGATGNALSRVTVFYGVTKLNQTDGFSSKITEIRMNNYNQGTFENDVALMRLATPITNLGTKNVNSVCLPAAYNSTPPEGVPLLASGWGILSSAASSAPNNLKKVLLHATSRSTCTEAYPGQVSVTQLCCLDKGKDTCYGDSGGPLVMRQANGQDMVVGVVSWGSGCAEPRNPGVYTMVAWYMHWINPIILT